MNCPKCGFEIESGAKFCTNCGATIDAGVQQETMSRPEKKQIEIPIEYKPISMWGYFGYNVLFSIPLVGLVFMLVYALGGTKNKNLKNFARSQFIWLIIVLVAIIVFAILYAVGAVGDR